MPCSPARAAPSCSGRSAPASRRPRRSGAAPRTCTSLLADRRADAGEAPPGVEAVLGRDDPELLDGCRSARQEPRRPGRGRDRARRTLGRHPGVGRGGARVPPARGAQSDRRHHRNERQDHDHAADGRDARGRRRACASAPATSARRSRRWPAASSRAGRSCASSRASSSRASSEFRADVGVLLNVTPDHLDRHGSFERLRGRQAARVRAPAPSATPRCCASTTPSSPRWTTRPARRTAAGCASRATELEPFEEAFAASHLRGPHNRANTACAIAVVRALGARRGRRAAALRGLRGAAAPARAGRASCAACATSNDSKATNVEATLQALASFDAPLHVILGGSLKGADFAPLGRPLATTAAGAVYLIGEAAGRAAPRARRVAASSSSTPARSSAPSRIAAAVAGDGRRRAALAGLRLVRPVPGLRGARRALPRARRGARVSRVRAPRRAAPSSCS